MALCGLLVPCLASATTVLLLAADDAPAVDDVESELLATGNFVTVDIGKRALTTTPLLSELTPWEAVLVWNEDPWDDLDGLGDVLNDYLNAGGAVVLAAHALEVAGQPGGAFAAGAGSPLLPAGTGAVAGDIDLGVADLSHPLYAGVTAVSFPDDGQGTPVLASGAELLGVDTAGNNVVAAWCDRSVVAINLFPPSIFGSVPDAALLLGNAILMTSLDAPPVADAGGPYAVDEGASVGVDAGASDDGQLPPVTYSWDVDGDGVFGDLTGVTATLDASLLDGPASQTITVRATDSCGRTSDAAATVTVANLDPAVGAVTNTGPVVEGSAVTLTATASDVPGDSLAYAWVLDDGNTASGASVSHTYVEDGVYVATVTVTDGDGGSATGSTTVTVTNGAPAIASVTNDGPAGEGSAVTFGVSASDPGGASDPLTYAWDFGDGATGSGPSPSHPYGEQGTYTATVTVSDDEGASAQGTTTVTVTNVAPTITLVSNDGPADEASVVTFAVASTDPGSADPPTYAWSFGDGASGTGAAPTHTYADDGTYIASVTVSDGDGGTDTATTTVTVTNVAPVIGAIGQDGPQPETLPVSFSVSATDVAGAADPITYAWDFGDGATATGSTATHAYADDGTYTVTATATDDGGASASTTAAVTITNTAPAIEALVGDTAGAPGQTLSFAVTSSDPAGAADPRTYAWSFGDGGTATGTPATHDWATPGTYLVEVTADDGDGGTATGSLNVVITNPGPTLTLGAAPSGILEGATATLTATAVDVLGGTVQLSWDWGDGSAASSGQNLVSASHAWPDDGPYTVTVTATDGFGDTATQTLSVPVANVAPSISTSPPTTGLEGAQYAVSLARTDPGGASDPPSWYLTLGPAGSSITGSVVTWTPTYPQAEAGAHAFTVVVDDGDGGTDTLSWTVDPDWADADNDGLPDTWEAANGLDPTVDDAAGDPDGDGLDNAAEYAGGTDPQGTNAPGLAVPTDPIDGDSVFTTTPTLSWDDATDPDGDTVTHAVEVYADEQLTSLLDSTSGLPTSAGTSTWTVTAALPEDALSWWRVRASDGTGEGPWSQAAPFFVDATNSPPTQPSQMAPLAETVTVLMPTFVTGPVADAEDDAIEVLVRITDDTGALFDTLTATEQSDGTWEAASATPLDEDREWSWTAEAVDARGATLGPSGAITFVVDVTNTAPTAPIFVSPEDGDVVGAAPDLEVTLGADPDGDGDPLVLRLQADVEEDFIGADQQEVGPTSGDPGETLTLQLPEDLPENRFVWLRARTEDDRGGASDWVAVQVFVDALPEPPTVISIVAPTAEEQVESTGLVVRWTPATDPEDGGLTYTVEVTAEGANTPLWTQSGLETVDGEGSVEVPEELDARAWLVRARATDDTGLDGPWSPSIRFTVLPVAGSPFDLGPGDGTGCSCAARVDGRGGSLVGLLMLLVAGGLRRRRDRA